MRVLVTGGGGYVGSVVVAEFVRQGHEVWVVDSLVQGHRDALCGRAELIDGDIGDSQLISGLLRRHSIEAVAHLAAATVVHRSLSEPRLFFEENLIKGLALVHAMLDCGVQRLIFSSTASVFGEPKYVPIDESHPLLPISSYGESKLAFERALAHYHTAYGLRAVMFRYFNAAGALSGIGEDHRPETHAIPAIFKAATGASGPFPIYGTDYATRDGTCIRDYVHVADLANAHLLALERIDHLGFAALNLGSESGISVRELITEAEWVTGLRVPTMDMPRRPGDPSVLVASSALAKERLGWNASRSNPRVILASAWEWFQAHPNGYLK